MAIHPDGRLELYGPQGEEPDRLLEAGAHVIAEQLHTAGRAPEPRYPLRSGHVYPEELSAEERALFDLPGPPGAEDEEFGADEPGWLFEVN